jgi:hypothetical protein
MRRLAKMRRLAEMHRLSPNPHFKRVLGTLLDEMSFSHAMSQGFLAPNEVRGGVRKPTVFRLGPKESVLERLTLRAPNSDRLGDHDNRIAQVHSDFSLLESASRKE